MVIMTSVHRVVLSQKAYQALKAEAMIRNKSTNAVLDDLIIGNISQKAKEVLKTIGSIEQEEAETKGIHEHVDVKTIKPSSQITKRPESHKSTKPQLAKDEVAVNKIKQLWTDSELSISAIAKEIGAARSTVGSLIDRLIERGELSPRPESGKK
jgi:DNA-binding XRE family transcriptional regulator